MVNAREVKDLSSNNNSSPMFVCILNPVPVVILVSPFLKQEFAKNEAWASPATPIIGILLLKLPSKSLSPNNSELFLILGNWIFLILNIDNNSSSHLLLRQLNKSVLEALVVSVTKDSKSVKRYIR